jgi:peroxiredoxin
MKWMVATVAALALALLTLPATKGFNIRSLPLLGGQVEAVAVCDADAKPAPLDFTLKDMNGKAVSLASFKGNVILLNFWATWCGPCKIEIPGFVELQEQYRDQGFVVLGLSVDDTPEQIQTFSEQFDINYPLLVGLNRDDFQEAWGPVWGIPITFWIDREGAWCKTHMGFATKDDFERELKLLL